ncbi:hypothetical protein D9758_005500 [Tetrapyrgos nigripes]|uniref:F-box domain-containing protein n=1 Tax=Tetrapyrgos nigripes TaxID=182062 RepID=A0A8H5GGF7_9AGAR|nr:hypothetical protein D9758_005500 [Tetrapyrgos nigripes]
MSCPNCGSDTVYKTRFDIANASSKVFEMLQSFPLTTFHSAAISQMLLDAETDHKHYGLEISRLRARLVFLEGKQKLLEKHMGQLKSVTASIRYLPAELLGRIFEIVCEETPTLLSKTNPSRIKIYQQPPFTLASVCRGWRHIVIGTSKLWSNLRLLPTTQDAISQLEPRFRLCLARSGIHPLSIDISFAAEDRESNRLVDLLIDQSARWRDARISAEMNSEMFPTLSGRSFPLLESLSIDDHYASPELHLFNAAPRLSSLKVNALPLTEIPITFTPINHVTHLELQGACPSVYRELEKFTHVQSVVYSLMDPCSFTTNAMPFVRSHLLTLELRLVDGLVCPDVGGRHPDAGVFGVLVDKLILPSLEKLTITNPYRTRPCTFFKGPWPSDTFTRFFQRSGCSLTVLRLNRISLSHEDVITLLKLNPALVELSIQEIHRNSYNFSGYTVPGSDSDSDFVFKDIITPSLLTALHAYNHGMSPFSPPLVPSLRGWTLSLTETCLTTTCFTRWLFRDGYRRSRMLWLSELLLSNQ